MTAYCEASDVRAITGQDLATGDISDDNLNTIITSYAIPQVNADISEKVILERASYIDSYRENKRDSSNTEYYTQTSWDWYIGDLNDDGEVNTSDALVYLYNQSTKIRSSATISALDETGKITLSSAPSSDDIVYITYRKSPVSISDALLKKACAELAAAIAYSGIEAREAKRVGIRGFSISRNPIAHKHYLARYTESISKLLAREPIKESKAEDTLKPLSYM